MKADDKGEFSSAISKWIVCFFAVEFFPTKDENNVYNSQKSDVMSDLALANVEALADDESVTVECPGGTDECARVLVGNTVHLFYKK